MTEETRRPTPRPPPGRRRALLVLATVCALYLGFLVLYVPRMTNYVMSDREFSGWSGPIAERLAAGARPYIDFVLPIPPGSFGLLELIQQISGRALLIQELWVASLVHLAMGVLAYAMAARLSTRRVALLVAVGTLVLVTQTPKECTYDHTSQLCAWASLAVGVYALTSPEARRRHLLWLGAGFLASSTLFFKQSTATGIVGGWALATVYRALVRYRTAGRQAATAPIADGLYCLAGGVIGLAAVAAGVIALGSTLPAFVQAVFGDAPDLKGGLPTILENLVGYVFQYDAIRNAVVPVAAVFAIGLGVARRRGTLHIGDEPARRDPLTLRDTLLVLGLAAVAFVGPSALLAGEVRLMDRTIAATADTLANIPAYGFVFAVVFFVAHLRADAADEAARRHGHALNAFIIAAMTSTLVYNTSFVQFTPFYYNNPSIPLALLFLFVATERTGRRWVTGSIALFCVLPAFGTKLNRSLTADTLVTTGHWAGMRVNYRGREILKAVERIHDLAAPNETVLVLPEDVQLVGLIDRPRPPVRGAILFVDQYPRRLLEHDRRAIDDHLPKVIVIHPRRERDWRALYQTWSSHSAAGELLEHVLDDLIPKYYRRDSSYLTIYFWDQGQLDVYVRDTDRTSVAAAEPARTADDGARAGSEP